MQPSFQIHLVQQRFWFKCYYILEDSLPCHATPYQHGDKVCNLCMAEKYAILTANDDALLNKRSELVNKCRHKNKYKLINIKLKL